MPNDKLFTAEQDKELSPDAKLRELADMLDGANRYPDGEDKPEGRVVASFSDTFLKSLSEELRYIASQVNGTDK